MASHPSLSQNQSQLIGILGSDHGFDSTSICAGDFRDDDLVVLPPSSDDIDSDVDSDGTICCRTILCSGQDSDSDTDGGQDTDTECDQPGDFASVIQEQLHNSSRCLRRSYAIGDLRSTSK